MWIFIVSGVAALVLAHTAPFPFLLEFLWQERSVWHMPATDGRMPPQVHRLPEEGAYRAPGITATASPAERPVDRAYFAGSNVHPRLAAVSR